MRISDSCYIFIPGITSSEAGRLAAAKLIGENEVWIHESLFLKKKCCDAENYLRLGAQTTMQRVSQDSGLI